MPLQIGRKKIITMDSLSKPKEKPPNYTVRATILFIVSLIPGLVLSLFGNVDSAIVRQSAQNLIPVAGFLASAAMAMTFFYSGKLLDFISPTTSMVENLRAPIRAYVEYYFKKLNFAPLVGDPQALLDAILKPFKDLIGMTQISTKTIMASPRETTRNGSISFGLLVASAFFSVLAMLTGDVIVLGVSLNVLILGAGSLILGWYRAQDNLHGYLTGGYLLKIIGLALDLDKPKS